MSLLLDFASMVVVETKARVYARGLQIATALDLPVTSWAPGDPTRSLYHFVAELAETADAKITTYIKTSFLDWAAEDAIASGDARPLKKLAYQLYGYEASEASYATTTITLTNAGGGVYAIGVGDLVVQNSATGKTYTNTTGGTLAGLSTLDLEVTADEPGSGSNAAATEIDELVTVYLGVTCSNASAAIGNDEESPASIVDGCRNKLGSLSPNGPWDAYAYVARASTLTGTTEITDARVYDDSDTGDVTVYLRGASGAVSSGAVTLVETALRRLAVPLCITLTVASASNVTIPVTYELTVYERDSRTDAELEDAVEEALIALFAVRPIGGDDGSIRKKHIESVIRSVSTDAFDVSVSLPAANTSLTAGQVGVLGTITATITRVEDP